MPTYAAPPIATNGRQSSYRLSTPGYSITHDPRMVVDYASQNLLCSSLVREATDGNAPVSIRPMSAEFWEGRQFARNLPPPHLLYVHPLNSSGQITTTA